jgi:hypothetical protein
VSEVWKKYIRNFQNKGWSYFSFTEWHHHCTDGPDCTIANIYSKSEIVTLMNKAGFKIKKMRKTHFPLTGGKYPTLERFFAKYVGFYNFVWATPDD